MYELRQLMENLEFHFEKLLIKTKRTRPYKALMVLLGKHLTYTNPNYSDSNAVKFAKKEFDLLNDNSEPGQWIREDVLNTLSLISEMGHSGFSFGYFQHYLKRLSTFTPITDIDLKDPKNWMDVTEGLFQSNRMSTLFKDGARPPHSLDAIIFIEELEDGGRCHYTNRFSSQFILSDVLDQELIDFYKTPRRLTALEFLMETVNTGLKQLIVTGLYSNQHNGVSLKDWIEEVEKKGKLFDVYDNYNLVYYIEDEKLCVSNLYNIKDDNLPELWATPITNFYNITAHFDELKDQRINEVLKIQWEDSFTQEDLDRAKEQAKTIHSNIKWE
jgi:hypothetical protein